MVVEDKYKRLLIGQLKGELDKDEQHELFVWVYEDSSRKKLFYELKDIWDSSKVTQRSYQERQQEEWAKLWSEIEKLERKDDSGKTFWLGNRIREFYKYAAILIIAFGASWVAFNQFQKSDFNTVVVPYGAKTNLELADGTKIWLNSGTTLKYPTTVKNNDVNVFLDGEAFFDVAHINNRKFNVKTSTINIQVLGTRFNVKSYGDDDLIEATLERGSISIEGKLADKLIAEPILLKPNQQATLVKGAKSFQVTRIEEKKENAVDDEIDTESKPSALTPKPSLTIFEKVVVEDYTSWKDHVLFFKSERLEDLAKEMERWYDVKIKILDKSLINSRYTGIFENETIEQAMEALSISLPFEYTINKNQIEILSKKKS